MEAALGQKRINQIASEYQINLGQVSQWKRDLQSQGASLFQTNQSKNQAQQDKQEADLYEQIGRLKMELEWLKKKSLAKPLTEKRSLIEPNHPALSIRRQCDRLEPS